MSQSRMIFRALVILALTGPAAAVAQDALREEEQFILPRIVDHACLDLVEEINGCENVILLTNGEESADLFILPDYRNTEVRDPILIARDFVWAGSIWGQWPSISQRENGSLVITSEQFGIGRDAWSQDLTLAWRDGRFMVAGLTYHDVDRILGFTAVCDVNLLSGRWEVMVDTYETRAESGKIDGQTIPASLWTLDRALPAPCDEATEQLSRDAELCLSDQAPDTCEPELQ